MNALFLICALALPPASFHDPHMVKWLQKNNPDAEVFFHPKPQRKLLKEYGYEQVPFLYKISGAWCEIWIKRKEKSDRRAA